mmetsp:Transcript_4986/g.7563  ORF Transcript_4986/g.7563 Transcript_4986/m.7563 type:complete len:154 (-) Transcript_4986:176-637(-)
MADEEGAVVSADHCDESMSAYNLAPSLSSQSGLVPRLITPQEVKQHSGTSGSFWCVVDGFVVDATDFIDNHPGGMRKLLSSNNADVGATGKPYGFSFSRGRNAHFPDTGERFREGVERYLSNGTAGEASLPSVEVVFPSYGKIVILGQLSDGQ